MAPSRLAPQFHSLPPILHKPNPDPMSGCSKAPRGLFALSRVTCIFTGTSISPDPSLRQRPDRYAIRAGRNLPDKEFRYLRTVIVTAAVYRGFDSELAPLLLTFRHWAGVSPYTSAFAFAETCVFAKQSPGPFHCGFDRPLQAAAAKRPFSRSYGAILPSSLTRVLPIALVFSTRLPVSDCGTDTFDLARHFSCQLGSLESQQKPLSFASRRLGWEDGFTYPPRLPAWTRIAKNALELPCRVMPLLSPGISSRTRPTFADQPPFTYPQATPCGANDLWWFRNINRMSIAYDVRPRLRPD